ncbi:hypothetical protein OPV22_005376 [Ensete ventricosum]|uniref:Uncharacterized protein n=1 Tax=Ensete ventricosum TaxID=4639 RepID=A0AAV8RCP2_ENSVE|nr:hypothetical protein OPV22_005376 [Ensete ventricosum]
MNFGEIVLKLKALADLDRDFVSNPSLVAAVKAENMANLDMMKMMARMVMCRKHVIYELTEEDILSTLIKQ